MTKNKKSLISIFLIVLIITVGIGLSNAVAPATITLPSSGTIIISSGYLHTSGTQILTSNGTQAVFNGITTKTFLNYEEYGCYPANYDGTDMAVVRSHGLNMIRIDIQMNSALYDVSEAVQTPNSLTFNSQFFSSLDTIVNAAAAQGLWVNICFGTSDGTFATGVIGDVGNGFPTWMYDGSWTGYFTKTYTNDGVGVAQAIRDFWNTGDSTAANVRLAYQTFWVAIAAHYSGNSNVVFGLYNEPQNEWGIASEAVWTGSGGVPNQAAGAVMYKSFMEDTIDKIRAVAASNLIFVNVPYLWDYADALKIDRSNIVVEAHAYGGTTTSFFQLGLKYNQPFILGEFGGVEESLSTRAQFINDMSICNTAKVSRCYLSYRPDDSPVKPSAQTWSDLTTYMYSPLVFWSAGL